MRTHLLLSTAVVALLGASAAFAGGNKVYLDQYDTVQTATITQTGSNNNVGSGGNHFRQQNGGLSGYNDLTITQSGNYNWVSRYAPGYQSGTANTANISQAGYDSDVELQQAGTQNGMQNISTNNGGNFNTIVQDGSASSSFVGVYQNGSRNGFDVVQGGAGNSASLTQSGTGGAVFARQATASSFYDPSSGHWTPVGGSSNTMTITQQTNSENDVVAVQGGGNNNSMTIGQYGDQLFARAWQEGYNNTINATQSGVLSNAYISQYGIGNIASSDQGNYAVATVNQTGTGNQSHGFQYGGLSGYLNAATITQTGDYNLANYSQNGYLNTVSVVQTSVSNESNTAQSGVGNNATIVQN
jgi:hypothetical protein